MVSSFIIWLWAVHEKTLFTLIAADRSADSITSLSNPVNIELIFMDQPVVCFQSLVMSAVCYERVEAAVYSKKLHNIRSSQRNSTFTVYLDPCPARCIVSILKRLSKLSLQLILSRNGWCRDRTTVHWMSVTADLIPLGRVYNLILTNFSRPEGVNNDPSLPV